MSVVKNTILARYEGGHVDVDVSDTPNTRVEQFLQLANVRTREGAVDLCRQQLRLLRANRITHAFNGQVRDEQQALGSGYQIGDKFSGDMIASVGVSVDVNGNITITPEVDDPIKLAEEALNRRVALIAAGVTSEYANPKTDPQAEGTGSDSMPDPFSYSGPLGISFSNVWTAPRPFWLSWLEIVLEGAGSSPTNIQIVRPGGTVLGSASIGAGDKRSVTPINIGFETGDQFVIYIQSVGTGATGLTATPRGTMV